MQVSTLRMRYLSKLIASMISMVISLVIASLVPRALGPEAFGNFEFLTSFYTRLMNFFNMGSLTAFYVKLSQRQQEFSLVMFYFIICIITFIFMFVFSAGVHLLNLSTFLLPDQVQFYIYLGTTMACLSLLYQVTTRMADAYGLTVKAEKLRISQRVIGLSIIIVLFMSNKLNLTTLFLYHYTISIFLFIVLIWLFIRNVYFPYKEWRLSFFQIKRYTREFFDYCHPLFAYSLFALVAGIFDRLLLQNYGGSIEQGFFGLGFRIATVCFLFSSSMSLLIQREFAIAFDKKDLEEMARLFRRYIPLMYAVVTYFACFVSIQAEKVTLIFAGEEYRSAAMVVSIIALHSIHQTYGQLGGSVFMATGQTILVRNIGIIARLFGIPVTYFALAPAELFGLGAGAIGLAVKFVLYQFIVVNVELFYNARLLNLKYFRYVGHQLGCFACLISLAYVTSSIVDTLMIQFGMLTRFFISGIIYTGLVMVLGLIFPIVFGLNRNHVRQFKQFTINKLFQT